MKRAVKQAKKREALRAGAITSATVTDGQPCHKQRLGSGKNICGTQCAAFRPPLTDGSAHPRDVGDALCSLGEGLPSHSPVPGGASLPYLLIDSPTSCKQALASVSRDGALGGTLQHSCMGSVVVLQLDGTALGSEAGFISLIKVSWLEVFVLTG